MLSLDLDLRLSVDDGVSIEEALENWPEIFAFFEADYESNSDASFTQDLAPTDFNTSTNEIDFGADIGFNSVSYSSGSPVYFSSTGTLPAGLEADTPYLLTLSSGTLYTAHKLASELTYDEIPAATPDEVLYPSQAALHGVGVVDITTQGTGVITCYSGELLNQITDSINGYTFTGTGGHGALEVKTDASGDKYFLSEIKGRDDSLGGNYDKHGKGFSLAPTDDGNIAVGEKRTVWMSVVAEVTPTFAKGNVKAYIDDNTDVNTTTGVITNTAHRLITGEKTKLIPSPGATLPTGFDDTTIYYARDLSADTFSLHPTETDANNNTNVIIPSAQGSGGFTAYLITAIGGANRQAFFCEYLDPDTGATNVISPQTVYTMRGVTHNHFNILADGIIGINGNDHAESWLDSDIDGVVPVKFYFPIGSTPPMRSDTSTPLDNDTTYYATRESATDIRYVRLHSTLAKAQAAVGLSRTEVAADSIIKYSDTGEFSANVWNVDDLQGINGVGVAATPFRALTYNKKSVLTFVVDYNPDTEAFVRGYFYENRQLISTWTSTVAKGLTPTAISVGQACTLFNSPQKHVPFVGKCYAVAFGSSVDAFDATKNAALHGALMSKYHITSPVTPLSLNNLTLSSLDILETAAVDDVVGTVENTTFLASIALQDDAGGLFTLDSGSIKVAGALDYDTATSHNITIRETLDGYANSAKDTVITINVLDFVETIPDAFVVGEWSVANETSGNTVTVTVSTLPYDGGDTITDIEYRVDGGTWTSSGTSTTGNFNITGLTDDVEVDIEIRAENTIGFSLTSDVKAVTPSVVVFDRAAITNIQFQWKSTDVIGDPITQITDLTGNGNHSTNITPPDVGSIDIGGDTFPTIAFNGTSHRMGFPNTVWALGAWVMWVVYKPDTTSGNDALMAGNNLEMRNQYVNLNGDIVARAVKAITPAIKIYQVDGSGIGAGHKLKFNDETLVTGTVDYETLPSSINLGRNGATGGFYFDGDILEIGMANTALSDADFNNLLNALSDEYNITISEI